jgi:hypothetical protein
MIRKDLVNKHEYKGEKVEEAEVKGLKHIADLCCKYACYSLAAIWP